MSIIDEAKSLVNGQRAQDYGDMNESFSRIARLWSAYLNKEVTKYDVAQMMVLLKVSRLKSKPNHLDSAIDIVGYMCCYESLLSEESV